MNEKICFLNSMIAAMKKNDSWCGETHIQKNVYLLKELYNENINFNFILYKFGPYSFELKDTLQELLAIDDLRLTSNGMYGPSYEVNDTKNNIQGNENLLSRIEKVAELTGSKPVAELEKLSTALYMIKNYSDLNNEEKAEKIHEFKPHIKIDVALDAIHEMNDIMKSI